MPPADKFIRYRIHFPYCGPTVGPATVDRLFGEIEKYEEQERAETFSYLKHALNETRASLGAKAAYKDE
jgi:hypothetical protein